MTKLDVFLTPKGWLDIRTGPAGVPEQRKLDQKDFDQFAGWSDRKRCASVLALLHDIVFAPL
jgi:hypothetical protein